MDTEYKVNVDKSSKITWYWFLSIRGDIFIYDFT